MKKKTSALIIIFLGLGTSFFILRPFSSSEKNNETMVEVVASVSAARDGSENLLFVKKGTLSSFFSDQKNTPPEEIDNLTRNFAKRYAQEILKNNPLGSQTINGKEGLKTPNVDDIATLTENQIGTETLPSTQHGEKDIRISSDDSKENQKAYIRKLAETWNSNFKNTTPIGSAMERWIVNQNRDALDRYLIASQGEVNSLLALSVPPSLQSFHIQNLNLWEKRLATYRAILTIQNDPLKALVAFQSLDSLKTEDQSLRSMLQLLLSSIFTP